MKKRTGFTAKLGKINKKGKKEEYLFNARLPGEIPHGGGIE